MPATTNNLTLNETGVAPKAVVAGSVAAPVVASPLTNQLSNASIKNPAHSGVTRPARPAVRTPDCEAINGLQSAKDGDVIETACTGRSMKDRLYCPLWPLGPMCEGCLQLAECKKLSRAEAKEQDIFIERSLTK